MDRRTAVAAWFVRLAQKIAVWALARPPLPPQRTWSLCSADQQHAVVAFNSARGWRSAEYHVAAIVIEGPGRAYVVDSAPGRRLVRFISDEDAERAVEIALTVCDYAVRVPLRNRKKHTRELATGAFDCVAVTKRAVGMYAPGVYTPRQLLAELWRLHDGTVSTGRSVQDQEGQVEADDQAG